MLYLIIHPECDYEMFNDGNIKSCTSALERRIVEADDADDALRRHILCNEGELTSNNIKNYFVLQVACKKCEVASKGLINRIREEEESEIENDTTAKEIAELIRLKKKFGEL